MLGHALEVLGPQSLRPRGLGLGLGLRRRRGDRGRGRDRCGRHLGSPLRRGGLGPGPGGRGGRRRGRRVVLVGVLVGVHLNCRRGGERLDVGAPVPARGARRRRPRHVQGHAPDDAALRAAPADPRAPGERLAQQRRCVADDDERAPRAGQRHVAAAPVAQEADVAAGVRAHRRHHDDLLLPPLERVHGRDLDGRVDLLPHEARLGRVGRHDADVRRPDRAARDEARDDVRDRRRLGVVGAGRALAALRRGDAQEGDGCVGARPGEAPRRRGRPRDDGRGVAQRAAVEAPRRERAQRARHAVLRPQREHGRAPRGREPLEERRAQAVARRVARGHGGRQLPVVAHEDEPPAAAREAHERRELRRVRGLVDEHVREPQAPQDRGAAADARRAEHVRLAQARLLGLPGRGVLRAVVAARGLLPPPRLERQHLERVAPERARGRRAPRVVAPVRGRADAHRTHARGHEALEQVVHGDVRLGEAEDAGARRFGRGPVALHLDEPPVRDLHLGQGRGAVAGVARRPAREAAHGDGGLARARRAPDERHARRAGHAGLDGAALVLVQRRAAVGDGTARVVVVLRPRAREADDGAGDGARGEPPRRRGPRRRGAVARPRGLAPQRRVGRRRQDPRRLDGALERDAVAERLDAPARPRRQQRRDDVRARRGAPEPPGEPRRVAPRRS